MEPAIWISTLVGVILVVFVVWLVLVETSMRVEPGTIALLLKRGKATSRALTPGRHFIQPWRKVTAQIYPSTELAFVAGGRPSTDTRVEYVDDPLRVYLADKAMADLSYTVRCQLDPGKLQDVHNQFGPEGLWTALRDATRTCLLSETAKGDLSVGDMYGAGYTKLQERYSKALTKALGDTGFQLRLFSLRTIDLGETGEVVQATVRAEAELEREQAMAKVRQARLENDVAMQDLAGEVDADVMLRYRQLEAWRDILQRWGGDRPVPTALTTSLNPYPTAPAPGSPDDQPGHVEHLEAEQHEAVAADEAP